MNKKPVIIGLGIIGLLLYTGFTIWIVRSGEQETLPQGAKPTPIPTAHLLGPGPYACSPEGICNLYSDDVRKTACTVTFADWQCLDSCADTAKRCTK